MSTNLIKTETMMDRQAAAEKLHELADKIKAGRVELKTADDSVVLTPADNVEFELEVEEEDDGDISIEAEIEWSPSKDAEDVKIA